MAKILPVWANIEDMAIGKSAAVRTRLARTCLCGLYQTSPVRITASRTRDRVVQDTIEKVNVPGIHNPTKKIEQLQPNPLKKVLDHDAINVGHDMTTVSATLAIRLAEGLVIAFPSLLDDDDSSAPA